MSRKANQQTSNQVITAVQAGNYAEALRLLTGDNEVALKSPELLVLKAIALAQIGRAEEATEAFKESVIAEKTALNLFNFAVHLHNIGEGPDALACAQNCSKLDAKNPFVPALIKSIETGTGDVRFSVGGGFLEPTPLARKRRYGYGRKHLFQVLAENQQQWVALGWTVVGFSILGAILMKLFFPLVPPAHPDPKNPLLGFKPANSFAAFSLIAFFLTTILASMVWTSLDLIDRRGKVQWMIPMMLCCFLFLPFLPQSLYMFAGRRDDV